MIANYAAADDDLLLAVASNFAPAAKILVESFTGKTGYTVAISSGSTGKLFAQIANGAPYDIFLAADSARPARLEEADMIVPGSRFTYAVGRLLLWARDVKGSGEQCIDALLQDETSRVSIANPKTAPYGAAAVEYLQNAGLWDSVQPRIVMGENIAQAFQFVAVGGAGFGFIASAQAPSLPNQACTWQVPETLFAPIRQQAVVLERAADNEAARAFVRFLQTDAASAIRELGYAMEGDGDD